MSENIREVLFLIPTLAGGGAERVVLTLLRKFDRSKFRLSLAVVDMRNAAYLADVPADIELISLGVTRVRYALPQLIRLIWQRKPHIVFSTLGHLNIALSIIRPILPNGIRYIAREANTVSKLIADEPFPRLWNLAYRLFLERFDCVVCQCEEMRDDLVSEFAFPTDKAAVIYNPVDKDRVLQMAAEQSGNISGKPPQGFHLVAAGRLTRAKGFDILIEAIALCRDPRIHVTVLGQGALREELERLAVARGVEKQVAFIGFQKNPYVYFRHADAFVLCSRYEGFPNVVLEALVCGTPVVATPAFGGIQEINRLATGLSVAKSMEPAALAEAITEFIKRPSKSVTASATRFFADQIVVDYEKLFLEMSR